MFKRSVSTKTKLLLILMAAFALSSAASSQINNCCSVDRQCITDEDWTNGYYAFQNNQCAAPAGSQQQASSSSQAQPAPAEDIDNCCFVDRQCDSDEEWVSGYNAYQGNQCAAPSQQQPRSSQSQPQTATSEAVNNCCFTGWQCDADEEWTSGYFAFQHGQCDAPSQWQGQQRQRQSGNQQRQSGNQQRQSGNQQRQSGNHQQQPQVEAQDDNPQPQSQPQSQPQNEEDPPAKNQNSATVGEEPGTYQATIDVTNPEDTEHELEDGTHVQIRQTTREEVCAAYPDWCLKWGI